MAPAVAALLTAACGASVSEEGAVASGAGGDLTGTLTVFAAASLTDVFEDLGERLTAENPGLEIRFNFAGSSALATQVLEGAPADVLASADEAQMERIEADGLVEGRELFASNPLMLAVPRADPAGITVPADRAGIPGLAELVGRDVTMAVCAPEVPCGAAAAEVLQVAGLEDVPDTYEEDVRAVLTKVELGEVDAGLVYVSDVHAAGDGILAFAFAESARAVNRYPIGVLAGAPNPEAAEAFVELVLSSDGRQRLRDAGFQEP